MKKMIGLGLALLCGTFAFGQYKGVIVSEVDNGGMVEGRTYRVYLELMNEGDQVHAIFGLPETPLSVKSTAPFFQSDKGGMLSNEVVRKDVLDSLDVMYDSWVTIGAEDNYQNYIQGNFISDKAKSIVAAFEAGGDLDFGKEEIIFWVQPDQEQVFVGPNKKLLIMQLTTKGKINGLINIQGRTKDGVNFREEGIRFTAG